MKKTYDGMNEEQARLARRENRALGRFAAAFLASCAYGAAAFFAVWKARDVIPALLYLAFPGAEGGDMARLYTAAVIIACGLIWFVTFFLLWHSLGKDGAPIPRKARTLALYCAGAGLAWLICALLEHFALR